MSRLVCCWPHKQRRSKSRGRRAEEKLKKEFRNELPLSLEQTKLPVSSSPGNELGPPQESDAQYVNVPESQLKQLPDNTYDTLEEKKEQKKELEKNQYDVLEEKKEKEHDVGVYNTLEEKEQAEDSGYAVLEDPSKDKEFDKTTAVISRADDNDYDYSVPFFEPSNEEEELVCQISDLNVPTIPSSCLELLDTLGSGQFGMVYKGVWVEEKAEKEVSTEVAVKTLREGTSELDKIKFLQEAVIMGQFKHVNILKLWGIVKEGDTLKLVMDLMPQGDLRHHLSSLKHSFATKQLSESVLKQILLSYTRQIVVGLGYFLFRCYVHRDLAARNILVSGDGVCKIADFGLSRDLHNDCYESHGGKIPIKWTAPEAIHYRKYSTASDIWSYGCVLYEVWSLGEKPFSQHTNTQTIEAIASGYRLPPPPGCTKSIYTIMIDCWHPDPESRPIPCVDVISKLQRPDFFLLKWDESEINQYSEDSRTVGTALENGHCLHTELQRRYLDQQGKE